MIRVAAALIFDDNGSFLVAERAHGKLAGKWEFPGGKLEEGETAEQAIIREMKEELDISVVPQRIAGVFSHVYAEQEVELILVHCEPFDHSQKILSDGSHNRHAWVRFVECDDLDFAPLDREIVEHLRRV
jgi:8-oxo-dGTP diphosphatase